MGENSACELDIVRIFDASRDRVYRAFTDPDQLSRWFGPVGWHVPRESVEIDARPGGHERFVMIWGEDPSRTSAVDAQLTEVVENELLVGTQAVSESAGSGGLSSTMTLRLEFRDEAHGRTRLAIRQGPYTEEAEILAREGWDTSFTKLDDLLAAG